MTAHRAASAAADERRLQRPAFARAAFLVSGRAGMAIAAARTASCEIERTGASKKGSPYGCRRSRFVVPAKSRSKKTRNRGSTKAALNRTKSSFPRSRRCQRVSEPSGRRQAVGGANELFTYARQIGLITNNDSQGILFAYRGQPHQAPVGEDADPLPVAEGDTLATPNPSAP